MTAFDLSKARKMRESGASWIDIGRMFGVSDFVARSRLDPKWLERRRNQVNATRRGKGEQRQDDRKIFDTPYGPAYAVTKNVHGDWVVNEAGRARYVMRVSLPYLSILGHERPA